MKISDIRVSKVTEEEGNLLGYATVLLDDCLLVKNLRIIQGKTRIFVAMPSKKKNNGKYEDVIQPINKETRDAFEQPILEEYNKLSE